MVTLEPVYSPFTNAKSAPTVPDLRSRSRKYQLPWTRAVTSSSTVADLAAVALAHPDFADLTKSHQLHLHRSEHAQQAVGDHDRR